MDPKTVSITSVTIINTLSFRSMYIQKMTEIEIYHDFTHCNHCIPNKIINLKNRKHIFQILRKQARAAAGCFYVKVDVRIS